MKTKERIAVYMRIIRGRTACVCKADNKRCKLPCERGTVTRDLYEDWQSTFKRNRYGK